MRQIAGDERGANSSSRAHRVNRSLRPIIDRLLLTTHAHERRDQLVDLHGLEQEIPCAAADGELRRCRASRGPDDHQRRTIRRVGLGERGELGELIGIEPQEQHVGRKSTP